jgi:DNA-binding response OmpR family regulator
MGTVLVADDDPDIRELVTFKLEQAGHRVITVADGVSAVSVARDTVPDLAIVDVTMSGLTGLQVCSALRADARTAQIPVILLTARANVDESRAGLDVGAVAYMIKPFSPRELVHRVDALVRRPPQTI